jgi:hypothetical protein
MVSVTHQTISTGKSLGQVHITRNGRLGSLNRVVSEHRWLKRYDFAEINDLDHPALRLIGRVVRMSNKLADVIGQFRAWV